MTCTSICGGGGGAAAAADAAVVVVVVVAAAAAALDTGFCHLIGSISILNKGNNKITELRTILQRESQNS